MSDLLIDKIAQRAANRETRIDMGSSKTSIAPPLKASDAHASEQDLGFSIPELLKLVYSRVGNGGFGPGYGLIGLRSGASDEQGHTAVDLYKLKSSADRNDPTWAWPKRLLPICHWGCAIYSCIDCNSPSYPIVIFDPNAYNDTWAPCFISTDRNLDDWLDAWASGADLWNETYGGGEES